MKSMLGVTIHYLSGTTLLSRSVGVFELNESHTATYIANKLNEVLQLINVNPDNVLAIVTDNGANMVKAVTDHFGKNKHLPCFAHTLNLVCENSIQNAEGVLKLIDKCRALVVWARRSAMISNEIRQAQLKDGVKEGNLLKPILDVKTRWNSTFYMLERIIKLIGIIGQIVIKHVQAPAMLTAEEIEQVKEMLRLLRPLEAMTRDVSGENYPVLSRVIPLVKCGLDQIKKITPATEVGVNLQIRVIAEIQRRFGKLEKSHLLAISTLLDPRFKGIHFSDALAKSSAIELVRREIQSQSTSSPSTEQDTSSVESEEEQFDLWQHHKHLLHKKPKTSRTSAKFQDDLAFFLNAPLADFNQCPFHSWEDMKKVYPKLYVIARKYLGAISTSVPSERLFSKAGAIASTRRSRLTTKNLSKLLFLHSALSS